MSSHHHHGSSSSSSGRPDDTFSKFISEVKEIEKRDSIYTSKTQIERLLRPGSTYANLNPFEVLLVDPEAPFEDVRKQYKKLSILLHPDKNPDDRERSQAAFDVVSKAYKVLEDETSRQKALDVYEEAKFKVRQTMEEKRKKLKKEGKSSRIEEDDFDKYKHAIKVMTMKLFADYERKRRAQQERDAEERKRKREEEITAETNKKLAEEFYKNYEESREKRVSSWQTFQKKATSSSSSKPKRKEFRPPKHKAETR